MKKFEDFIHNGFIGLLSIVAVWIGSKIDAMSDSVGELNLKMAVAVEQLGQQKESIKDHEERLTDIERRRTR